MPGPGLWIAVPSPWRATGISRAYRNYAEHRVYVLDRDGRPLVSTTRFGKVRGMLKSGQAKIVRTKPFTIQLLYEPETHVVQKVMLG